MHNCNMKLNKKKKEIRTFEHYNLPTGTDVTVIMPADTLEAPCKRDVVVYKSAQDHQVVRL